MIGNDIRCRYPYSYSSIGEQLDKAFTVIQLKEPHEAGEIIDDYWLIANENILLDGIEKYKFEIGYYVKGIDIRYFEIFETDINYDNREDLRKFGTKIRRFNNQNVITNLYSYIGSDYPKELIF